MELRQYWSILRRWFWLVTGVTVVGGLAAFFISWRTEPIYRSTVTLRIDPSSSRLTNEYAGLLVAEQLAGTYSQQIKMRPVMEAALQELSLQERLGPTELASRVSVAAVRDTQLIEVSVEHEDRTQAARLANTIADVFIRQNRQFEQARYAASKESLSVELDKVQNDMENTQAAIDDLGTPADDEEQLERDRLEFNLSSQRATYSNLLASFEELRIAEASSSSNVVVVESAMPSAAPVRPRTLQNTILAALVSAMIGFGVVYVIEYLDDTIKSPDDVTAVVGLPTLGAIGQIEGDDTGSTLVTVSSPRAPISEAFRALRTNIQFARVDGQLHSLMVTSAGPGEGKSTTAANLAVALAQAGRSVVLIDADLRRPVLHRLFGLSNSKGLTTALLDLKAPASAHLQPTEVPGLGLMTSGPIPPNPAELLGSRRMVDVLGSLKQGSDVVILDSTPVLTVADALVLAPHVDGTLLLVEANKTRRDALVQAREALQRTEGHLFGIALNKISVQRSDYYYYAYYQQGADRAERPADGHQRRRFLPGLRR
jgi:capsular exopolysaccharide synthesis family protein